MTEDKGGAGRWSGTLDVVLTVILALSAIATAWSGYQASQWGGEQSAATSRAAALRAEAERAGSTADTQRTIDVLAFLDWVDAMAEEADQHPSYATLTSYEPVTGTRASFLFHRFRDEFTSAFEAWIATGPLADRDAPPTPFEMPEYRLAAQDEADNLTAQAQELSLEASRANENSSKWVLMGVMFAMVLFFATVGSKAYGWRRTALSCCSVAAFGVALVVLFSHPVVW